MSLTPTSLAAVAPLPAFNMENEARTRELRVRASANNRNPKSNVTLLANDAMSPLFLAVIEATEEAIYNSLFRATTMNGRGHTVEALPLERTLEILRRHNSLNQKP